MFGAKLDHRCAIIKVSAGLAIGQSSSIFLHTELVEEHPRFVRHIRLEQNASHTQSFSSKVNSPVDILSRLTWGEAKYVVPGF